MVYAIKNYNRYPKESYKSYNDFLKQQLLVHHQLKQAKIPTWNTCRIHNRAKQLLLTYGNKESECSLLSVEGSSNEGDININEENKTYKNNLDILSSFPNFLEKLTSIVYAATKNNLHIYSG